VHNSCVKLGPVCWSLVRVFTAETLIEPQPLADKLTNLHANECCETIWTYAGVSLLNSDIAILIHNLK